MHLAPLAAALGAVLIGLPLTFAQELDARGVSKQMQALGACLVVHLHVQALLPAADCAVVGCGPRQASHTQQRLHQAQRLPQRQAKQALDGQAKLDRRI